MIVYVTDASVASRFLLVEDLSDKATLVLEDFLKEILDLKAPKLIIYEVGNTLWKAVKQGFITLEEAKQKLLYFLKLKIDFIELNEEESITALEWSAKNNMTYYDSVYIESCKKIGATLLTADNTLYEKSSKVVSALHLKNYRK